MRAVKLCLAFFAFSLFLGTALVAQSKVLMIYFIDVEGGQATLFIAPSRESVLVDTGFPGDRDANRIAAAAREAGISHIDNLLITHYHADHAGGAAALVAKIPVRHFFDHGESVEHTDAAQTLFASYQGAIGGARRTVVKPGFKIPVQGLDWTIVSSAGKLIDLPLAGGGKANPDCANFIPQDIDTTENAQSNGSMITFGKLRIADLGDLTWNKERDLVCPSNKLGTVDLFIVSHHGMNISNSPALVHALHPRVAIMDNGATKGGTTEAWTVVHSSPGLEDLWQLHFALANGVEKNSPADLIANPQQSPDRAYELKVTANPDGHFAVTNERNGYSKTY